MAGKLAQGADIRPRVGKDTALTLHFCDEVFATGARNRTGA
jgi:hypothetical protein